MCGLAGLSMSHDDNKMNAAEVAKTLLLGIAGRGPDATGAAWHNAPEDTVELTKIAVPAWRFLEARQDVIPSATPTMILHTRYATHGTVAERKNNHPIVHGNIIGTHNGVLQNHTQIFKDLDVQPLTGCDSEAIMALLNNGEHPTDTLGKIRGDATVAWINLQEPEVLHLANVIGRPLHLMQTEQGSLIYASTKKALDDTLKANGLRCDYYLNVPEKKYLKVEYGVITEYSDILNVKARDEEFAKKFAWTSGIDAKKESNKGGKKADHAKGNVVKYDDGKLLTNRSDSELQEMEDSGSRAATDELNRRLKEEWKVTKTTAELKDIASNGWELGEQAYAERLEEEKEAILSVKV